MDEFKDYTFAFWVYQEYMDFNQYKKGKKPVYLISKMINTMQF